MLQGNVISRSTAPSPRTTLALMAAAVALLVATFQVLPSSVLSEDSIGAVAVGALLLLLLSLLVASPAATVTQAAVGRFVRLIWWFVLVCEVIFDRLGDTVQTYEGNFSIQAYGEGAMWVLAFLVLLLVSMRYPQYLRSLFSGSYKWVSLFVLVCILSVPHSPGKFYSAAWAFKLLLIVLLLRLAFTTMQSVEDITAFLKATLWGFLILTVVPAAVALSDPATAFAGVGGRLNANPDELSATAGSLLILAIALYALERRKRYGLIGLIATVVMFLALGKAGVFAALLGVVVFRLAQRKVGRTVVLFLGVIVVGLVIISATPLAKHLQSYEGTSTLTGRTVIWSAALQAMTGRAQDLVFGHGYLATYFLWTKKSGVFSDVVHLHNGFMEVAYNNGLIGLALMLMIHLVIVRNIFRNIRATLTWRGMEPDNPRLGQIYLLAIASAAVYLNLFVNGLFNASFGGRAMSPFMLLLAVYILTEAVSRLVPAIACTQV